LYQARGQIERLYGSAVSFAGGLGPLPAWVRGRDRVRTWVWAKLLINAVRLRRLATAPPKPAPRPAHGGGSERHAGFDQTIS
jgi:hypothetical protein